MEKHLVYINGRSYVQSTDKNITARNQLKNQENNKSTRILNTAL